MARNVKLIENWLIQEGIGKEFHKELFVPGGKRGIALDMNINRGLAVARKALNEIVDVTVEIHTVNQSQDYLEIALL